MGVHISVTCTWLISPLLLIHPPLLALPPQSPHPPPSSPYLVPPCSLLHLPSHLSQCSCLHPTYRLHAPPCHSHLRALPPTAPLSSVLLSHSPSPRSTQPPVLAPQASPNFYSHCRSADGGSVVHLYLVFWAWCKPHQCKGLAGAGAGIAYSHGCACHIRSIHRLFVHSSLW